MLIFSRQLFLKKFRAHFHEASDKSGPKTNRNSEVPISFLELQCLSFRPRVFLIQLHQISSLFSLNNFVPIDLACKFNHIVYETVTKVLRQRQFDSCMRKIAVLWVSTNLYRRAILYIRWLILTNICDECCQQAYFLR